MAVRRVGGVAGAHRLDGPGQYSGARVALAMTVGRITIAAGATLLGSIAAGSIVGTAASAGAAGSGPVNQLDGLTVTFASAADFIDLDYAGAFG